MQAYKKDINLCHLNFCLHLLSVIYLVYLQYMISSRLFLTAVLKVCMYLCCLCVDENLCLCSAHLFQVQQTMCCGQRQKEPVSLLQTTEVLQGWNEKRRSGVTFLLSQVISLTQDTISVSIFKM